MKTKLTLYVEEAAVRRGKAWARRRRVPLSQVIEQHLNRLAEPEAGNRFLARWRGKFRLPEDGRDDARTAAILAKHVRD